MPEKILFIELFQPFAQYRNPFTFYYAQTYPLPPKSTIIGMLQNACDDWYGNKSGVENWWNLKISVHGGFESVFWNYQQLIKGELSFSKEGILINNNSEMEKRYGKGIYFPLYGSGITAQRSPIYQQELFNGHLYIFIKAVNDKQIEILKKIKDELNEPRKVLYLGRSEDVIFIRKVLEGEEIEKEEEKNVEGDIKLTYPTYVKLEVKEKGERRKFLIKIKKYPVYSIPIKVLFKNREIPVKHKAKITKETEREVEFEPVIYTGYDYSVILKENEPIDVEIFKIDDKKEIRIINPYGWL